MGISDEQLGAAVAGHFGAIVYSPSTGKFGWASEQLNIPAAQAAAFKKCGRPDGKVATSGGNRWLALARSDQGHWAGGNGWTDANAREDARNRCDGRNKEILVSFRT
jgi:hypothetical protein